MFQARKEKTHPFQVSSDKIQRAVFLLFYFNLRTATGANRCYNCLNILTSICVLVFHHWRVADKSAEKTHNLPVIVSGMLAGQTSKSIDTAETDREHFTAPAFPHPF